MVTPYAEERLPGILLRTFSAGVPESDLAWHFDEEHRRVRCLGGSKGWMLQVDDGLPFPFPVHRYRIRAGSTTAF